jgi:hypothetical protein
VQDFHVVDEAGFAEPGGSQEARGTVKFAHRRKIGLASQFKIFDL